MNPFTESITLSGRHAILEPLSHDHHDGLVEAVRDGELSIVASEWPSVKQHLQFKLGR